MDGVLAGASGAGIFAIAGDECRLQLNVNNSEFNDNVAGAANTPDHAYYFDAFIYYPGRQQERGSSGSGGALSTNLPVFSSISKSVFRRNRAHGESYRKTGTNDGTGGAIAVHSSRALFIDECVFEDNHADRDGHHLFAHIWTRSGQGFPSEWQSGFPAKYGFSAEVDEDKAAYQNFVVKDSTFGPYQWPSTGPTNSNPQRWAKGGPALIAVPIQLNFYCPLGMWMPDDADVRRSFTGCAHNCSAGRHGDRHNITDPDSCPTCPVGHFCPEGIGEPIACPSGTCMPFTGAISSTSCIRCSPGYSQPQPGLNGCDACLPGTFADQLMSTGCTDCPVGHYCPEAGTVQPLACPAGNYQNLTGQAACMQCPAGQFQPERGETSCDECAAGGYCNGVASCGGGFTRCKPGTFNPRSGSYSIDACQPCPSGTTSSQPEAKECNECEPGTYARQSNGECVPCPHPFSSGARSTECDICISANRSKRERGFYLDSTKTSADCKPCPPLADCSAFNTSLETLFVQPGHWRASPISDKLAKCRKLGGDNNSGTERCAGGDSTEANGNGLCNPRFKGPECQLCSADDRYLVDGHKCEKCDKSAVAAGRLIGLAFGILIACGLLATAFSMRSWRKQRLVGPPLRFADRAVDWCLAIGLMAKVKILLGFYQVRHSVPSPLSH